MWGCKGGWNARACYVGLRAFNVRDPHGIHFTDCQYYVPCILNVWVVVRGFYSVLQSLRALNQWSVGGIQAGKICLAVPVGDNPPKGLILGTGPGIVYVEPPAAVPLNNELAAARGEAAAAEEAVLWKLTGQVADAADTLQQALDAVGLVP
jgi:hypothetical protein